ncbi:MAG: YlxR family protein [Candidatus Nanopelagicus sp.]
MSKKKLRQRSCIACRRLENWTDLIRTVLVNQQVIVDLNHRMPGRGAWLHRNCITVAIERKTFNRSFNIEGEIKVDQLEDYLKNLSDY